MSFKLSLADVDLLTNTIPIIAEILDEGVFKVNKDGLSLASPDRTMVSITDLRILPTAFEEFKVEGEDNLGLNLANLAAVLKRVKPSDKLVMERQGNENKLRITVKGNGIRTFEVPLLDITTEKPPIDQLNFSSRIEIDPSIVEEGISDAEVIGDSVVFEAGPEGFRMHAKGDMSSTHLEVVKKDKGLLKLEASSNIKAQYPLEYLKKMIKAGKLSKHLVLEFGNDYPARLSFKKVDKMSLSFILAPRVTEE